jgi:sarcosine oxidase delta subunit
VYIYIQAIAEALPGNVMMLNLMLDGNDRGYAKERWQHVINRHRYLQKLSLPCPVLVRN